MVWVVTGDGDALSIGGNHILHSMRKNVDIRVVMFNNRIYGLTKGQASPTSELGQKTKSTPIGSIDYPIHPLMIALAAEASFVARTVDTQVDHIQGVMEQAGFHRGSAFVEVLQNCNIFNDGAHRAFTDREVREDRMLVLEHGKPMLFGKNRDMGLRLDGLRPEIVQVGEDGVTEADILVHDETSEDPTIHNMLARIYWPEFPVPIGVIRNVPRPTHDELIEAQIRDAISRQGAGRHREAPRRRRDLDRPMSGAGAAPPPAGPTRRRRRDRRRPRRRPDLGDAPRRPAADARRRADPGRVRRRVRRPSWPPGPRRAPSST